MMNSIIMQIIQQDVFSPVAVRKKAIVRTQYKVTALDTAGLLALVSKLGLSASR